MGFFDKIKQGMKRTREIFSGRMDELVETYVELNDDFYDELTDILIMADVGMKTTELAVGRLKEKCKNEKIGDPAKAREALKEILTDILQAEPMKLDSPMVLLIIGVNGVGKTTTIGKLANKFKNQGLKVYLGAADTLRAAAVEQLCIWGERIGVPVIKQAMGADPASVAFDTLSSAKKNGADVVIIDTAGRLHNKVNLMNELTKIKNVMKKVVPGAPNDVMLVLDGSTGQNAFEQAKQFSKATEITSLTVTKLDGTAKGGVVLGISDQFSIPVKYIGLGEGVDDLRSFDKELFVESLLD